MSIQTALVIILGFLVVLLAILLITRIRRERRRTAAIRRMNLEEFSDFLKTNSLDGTIQDVAGKVSDLLIKSFGCERIVFLRKKRHNLELNYFHGLRSFNRYDFRLPISRKLVTVLQENFLPRHIKEIKEVLPSSFYALLEARELDTFFPIFWRDNLYGLYFIRSTIETRSPAFTLLVASLAQSLSAAYHIKWHEVRYGTLQKQLDDVKSNYRKELKTSERLHTNILKLVRHHDSETMIPRLIGSIRKDLKMNRIAFLYEDRKNSSSPAVFQEGIAHSLPPPAKSELHGFLKNLNDSDPIPLDNLLKRQTDNRMKNFASRLKEAGLKYAAPFPLSPKRAGVLVWGGGEELSLVNKHLQSLRPHVADLIDNVESFEQMEEMSYTDNLTGLANRRYLSLRLEEEINRAKRYKRKLALIFFDLDGLKTTNDNFGHLAGDAILKQMGRILRKSVRAIDIIARYGGDEFCIIMPEADETTCLKFMERLRTDVTQWEFTIDGLGEDIHCTVSQGGAVFPDHADTPKQLMHAADMALLQAKEAGGNKSILYRPQFVE